MRTRLGFRTLRPRRTDTFALHSCRGNSCLARRSSHFHRFFHHDDGRLRRRSSFCVLDSAPAYPFADALVHVAGGGVCLCETHAGSRRSPSHPSPLLALRRNDSRTALALGRLRQHHQRHRFLAVRHPSSTRPLRLRVGRPLRRPDTCETPLLPSLSKCVALFHSPLYFPRPLFLSDYFGLHP